MCLLTDFFEIVDGGLCGSPIDDISLVEDDETIKQSVDRISRLMYRHDNVAAAVRYSVGWNVVKKVSFEKIMICQNYSRQLLFYMNIHDINRLILLGNE